MRAVDKMIDDETFTEDEKFLLNDVRKGVAQANASVEKQMKQKNIPPIDGGFPDG